MSRKRKERSLRDRAPVGAWVGVTCRNGETYAGRVASWGELSDGDYLLGLRDGAGQWRINQSEITALEVIDVAEYTRRYEESSPPAAPPQSEG